MSAKHTAEILPPLTKPLRNSKHWDGGIDWPLAGERAARLEREDQLRGALECRRELLYALKAVVADDGLLDLIESIGEKPPFWKQALVAIARAEGGQS